MEPFENNKQEALIYELKRREILCSDIIKATNDINEKIVSISEKYTHIATKRGFSRNSIRDIEEIYKSTILNLMNIAESNMPGESSPELAIIQGQLKALKITSAVVLKTIEKIISRTPELDKQIFFPGRESGK